MFSGQYVDTNGLIPVNILELPGAKEYSMQDLMQSEIEISNIPCSSNAFDFNSTTNFSGTDALPVGGLQQAAGVNIADTVVVSNVGGTLYNGSGSLDDSSSDGWTCILVRFEGLPASTTPIAEIEYAIHIEGSPVVATSSAATFVPSGMTPVRSHPGTLENSLEIVSRAPACAMKNISTGSGKKIFMRV